MGGGTRAHAAASPLRVPPPLIRLPLTRLGSTLPPLQPPRMNVLALKAEWDWRQQYKGKKFDYRSPLVLHEACAWLNVNRATDSNLVHVHHPQRWSAVYFVQSGGVAEVAPPAGHLVFRGGHRSAGGRRRCSHTYFAVPPEPGVLWIFPGSTPHCVFPYGEEGARGSGEARVSVAVNLLASVPPPVYECDLDPENVARLREMRRRLAEANT